MGDENIKTVYYHSEIDRINGDIDTYDEIIRDAQERKQAALEHREMLVSVVGRKVRRTLKEFRELSVRVAIRQSLLDSGLGLRPKEIVDFMLSKGYTFPGATIPNTRVSNELKYLMDADLVTKEDGHYFASQGGAT